MSAQRAQAGGGGPDAYRLVILEGLTGTGKSTMCRLMDAPPDEIVAHARWIADRVRPLGARLIYLQARSAAEGLQRIARTRGRAWLEAMSAGEAGSSRAARARLDSPFFRHRGLHGHAGTVAFLQGYLELCATLVPRLDLQHLKLETWQGDWSAYHVETLRFLGLTAVPDHGYTVWWWTKRPGLWLDRVLGAARPGSSARMNR